jgi:hypothetical protein
MAKVIARRKRVVRRDWTRAEVKELRKHSKDKTRVKTISRALKRTPGALRQNARASACVTQRTNFAPLLRRLLTRSGPCAAAFRPKCLV